jgi:RNA-binding protein
MNLTERQKKFLRGKAHSLKPVVSVGDKGITPSLMTELDSALDHHELIKVRVRVGDRDSRAQVITELTSGTGALLVSRVGNIAALYRPRKQKPAIVLPQ